MTQMGLSQQIDYNQRQTCPEWVQPGIVTQVISSIPSRGVDSLASTRLQPHHSTYTLRAKTKTQLSQSRKYCGMFVASRKIFLFRTHQLTAKHTLPSSQLGEQSLLYLLFKISLLPFLTTITNVCSLQIKTTSM